MLTPPDILSKIKFYSTEENGRKTLTNSDDFGSIFSIGIDRMIVD